MRMAQNFDNEVKMILRFRKINGNMLSSFDYSSASGASS